MTGATPGKNIVLLHNHQKIFSEEELKSFSVKKLDVNQDKDKLSFVTKILLVISKMQVGN